MSNSFAPTLEQQAILESTEERIAIVAAAGAGKTGVLVQRYIGHVLRESIDPDRILTITFTRKAAAEMKERIVAGLREAQAYDEAQIAETGPIQTIHALCEQILRENALILGIDPKFEILSDAQTLRLQAEVIEEAISSVRSDQPVAESLIAKLAGRRSYGGSTPYSLLQSSVASVLSHFRGCGLDAETVSEIYSSPDSFRRFWEAAVLSTVPSPIYDKYGEQTGPDWRENLKAAYKSLRKAVPPWLKNPTDPKDDRILENTSCGIVQIALEAWSLLEDRMRTLQAFDFCLLESLAARVLESSEDLRASLKTKFQIVMVDEAQDLNQTQYRLLDLISQGKLLTVGDGQQSIYGFRHADLETFERTHNIDAKRLTKNLRSTPGILNFIDRVFLETWSERYIQMAETRPFDLDVLAEEDYSGVELWEVPNNLALTAGYIGRLIDHDGVPEGKICVLARDSRSCQIVHEALQQAGIASRIHGGTEKFYTRMEVRDLANTLRALADPYHDFSLLALLRGPAVGLSVDALARLGLHRPVIETLETLAGSSVGKTGGETPSPRVEISPADLKRITDFLQWLQPLRAYADRLSAWEVLSEVFASTPFLSSIAAAENGEQQVANVRKLLVLAGQDSHLGPLEFADQIREIQALRHKEGDAEQPRQDSKIVRIMTIHKSKGLEFPVVVLPDTNAKLNKSAPDILFESKLQLLSAKFDDRSTGMLHKFLAERKKERELAEELRVLYVAMTRARERLCIALYPTTSHDTVSKRIRKIVGDPAHDSIRYRKPVEIA